MSPPSVLEANPAARGISPSSGSLVTYLKMPPSEFAPYSVPCGPRSTSMRAIERVEIAGQDRAVDQAAARTERRFVHVDGDGRADAAGVDAAQDQAALTGLALVELKAGIEFR